MLCGGTAAQKCFLSSVPSEVLCHCSQYKEDTAGRQCPRPRPPQAECSLGFSEGPGEREVQPDNTSGLQYFSKYT